MNKYLKVVIIIVILLLIGIIVKSTLSKEEEFNLLLEYNSSDLELEEKIYNYIDNLDNYLIPNSSYNYSSILTDNYDFLVTFACSYILHNSNYSDNIIVIENVKYVNIDIIYDITYKVFGKKDFYIINDNKKIDNLIELKEVSAIPFNMKLDSINISNDDNILIVNAKYKIGDLTNTYVYTFVNDNNHLYIENIELEDNV